MLGNPIRSIGSAATGLGARTREGAEDIWAEARRVSSADGSDAAVAGGLIVTTALGLVELPVAAALGAGYGLVKRLKR